MKKRLLACLLTLCMVVGMVSALGISASAATATTTMTALSTATAAPAAGTTVTISTADELKLLASYTNDGKTTAGITFVLTADIALNAGTFDKNGTWSEQGAPVAFTPIGNTTNSFKGTFNGQGYTVSGLYINSTSNNVALFGEIAGRAKISNLTVANSYVRGTSYVAAIVGSADWISSEGSPVINNCVSNAYVHGASSRVGGIVGGTYGAHVYNCTNNGTITADHTYGVGGIVGHLVNSSVINCLNAGAIGADSAAYRLGGIVGYVPEYAYATIENSLNVGKITSATASAVRGAISGGNASSNVTLAHNYYLSGSAPIGVGDTTTEVGAEVQDIHPTDIAKFDAVQSLNAYISASADRINSYNTWKSSANGPVLSDGTAVAIVTAGTNTYAVATLADGAYIARQNEGSTLKVRRSFTAEACEIGGNYTLDLNGRCISAETLKISIGTLTITDSTESKCGSIVAATGAAIRMQAGALKLNAGVIRSMDSYAIQNVGTGCLYLSGTPRIIGANADIYVGYANTLYGNDGADTPVSYDGAAIGVDAGWTIEDGSILAKGAKTDKFFSTNHNASKFTTEFVDGNVVYAKYAFGTWAIVGALFAIAAALVIFTLIRTAQFKKKMRSVTLPTALMVLAMVTTRQLVFMIIAGVACVAALVYCLVTVLGQNKKLKEKAAADKEAAAKKKPVVTPVSEKAAEEAAAEDAAEEVAPEAPAAEEAAEEVAPEAPAAEEAAEEVAPEAPAAEEAAEEVAPEAPAAEEAAEEVAPEAPAAEEAAEEVAPEAPVATDYAAEVAAEEPAEEAAEEVAPEAPVAPAEVAAPVGNSDRVVIAETDAAGNTIYSTYKKSFTARMIQSAESDDDLQVYYETLKNALLSYKKVTSRLSWSYESFKTGHTPLAKFAIRGKTLCLFLAIDPATLEGSKYNVSDVSKAKKYATVPCRLRLTSKRSVKWALELVAKLAETHQLVANPKFKEKSYRMPYESTEALIEKGLVKKVQ